MSSNLNQQFVNYVVELMQGIGPVTAKRMFGGHGIFLDGIMFALIDGHSLYLKVSPDTETDFTELGLEAFSFNKNGKQVKMSYYQAPEDCLENIDDMVLWANKAYSSALKLSKK